MFIDTAFSSGFGNALPHPVLADFLHFEIMNQTVQIKSQMVKFHYEMDDHIQATMQYVLQDEILPIERDCLAASNG